MRNLHKHTIITRQVNLHETGKRITQLMHDSNISVSTLREILGFSTPMAIYKWRQGRGLPTLDNLLILSDIFNRPIESIIVTTELTLTFYTFEKTD